MLGGQPAYVWFANSHARGDADLLARLADFGPLTGEEEIKWMYEKGAAATLRLILLLWHALQHRDPSSLDEARTLIADHHGARAKARGEVIDCLLDYGYEDSDEVLEELTGRGVSKWRNVGDFLSNTLSEMWRAVSIHPRLVAGPNHKLRVTEFFEARTLSDIVRLRLFADIALGVDIRRCANDGCVRNKLFRAVRSTRIYCSRECQNIVMQRRHRERQTR